MPAAWRWEGLEKSEKSETNRRSTKAQVFSDLP